MSEKSNESALGLIYSHLPTSFTDGVNIGSRMDGSILLQSISATPDCLIENFRTVMNKKEAVDLINNLAMVLDYYPVKPLPKAKKEGKPSKTIPKK